MSGPGDINVSLEQHLIDTLDPLQPLLPPELTSQLQSYIAEPRSRTIPYDILLQISKWTRQPNNRDALDAAKLDLHAYNMVSLLAGATTSPERNFPPAPPSIDPAEEAANRKYERKALTALVNALLSIGGSAAAAWWASDKTGWSDEWRVLLSLCVAFVVAASEGILYLIWQSRASKSTPSQRARRRKYRALHKKDAPDSPVASLENSASAELVTSKDEGASGLRQRTGNPQED
ncbi:hypothetical protein HGRIS_004741 [Hohenbuehelia grisea]|uniref:Uncharacterized protein n=1 Tax=Hohenbuehelia grisea TaxID=104357 RepID=A0ABR3JD10_9AGAR